MKGLLPLTPTPTPIPIPTQARTQTQTQTQTQIQTQTQAQIQTHTQTQTPTPTPVPNHLNSKIGLPPTVNQPLAGAMEPTIDGPLPEMLARDLELSKSVFEERNMTSGAPHSNILSVYKPGMAYSSRMSAPYRTASSRVQLLGAIEERSSKVSFMGGRGPAPKCDDTASDLDSLTGTEASYDAGPMTFHLGERSIVTNATSLASSDWRPSSKGVGLPGNCRRESSWIEIDSDGEEEDEVEGETEEDGEAEEGCAREFSPSSPLASRLATPPPMMDGLDSQCYDPSSINSLSHRKSHSTGGPAPLPTRHQLTRSTSESWRPLATSRPGWKRESLEGKVISGSPPPLEMPLSELPRRAPTRRNACPNVARPRRGQGSAPEPVSGSLFGEHDDELMATVERSEQQPLAPRRHDSRTRDLPPSSTPPGVAAETEHGGGAQPFELSFQGDELARVVPLPPDVIETLRISTMCFPETMLLSSSLTIETIRSYSRKMRQPGAEPLLMGHCPTGPYHRQSKSNNSHSSGECYSNKADQKKGSSNNNSNSCNNHNGNDNSNSNSNHAMSNGNKSMWRRVVKRGSPCSHRRRESRTSSRSHRPSPSLSTLDTPKPWAALKNVFGDCSDYICDALYAHILAYNYVSALVARSSSAASVSASANLGRPGSSGAEEGEDIPRKAATLLGFGRSAGIAAFPGMAARASPKAGGTSQMVMGQSSPGEAALRSVQLELLRCMRQLIATARLMTTEGGSGEEAFMVEMDKHDDDRLLLRSLCEIVRVSEGFYV